MECKLNPAQKSGGLLLLLVAGACAWGGTVARADVRLPRLFSDNMVLQQGMAVPVWGWADEGEKVSVAFRGQTVETTAKNGKWMVRLGKLKAGGPDTLTVTGKNTIQLTNVLTGEVWLCSGQSNMEWPLQLAHEPEADIQGATNSQIRLFTVPRRKADEPVEDVESNWRTCTPQTAAAFSAVGYYFGRDLQKDQDVPVGLIEAAYSGSPAKVWMRHSALEENAYYKHDILGGYPILRNGYEAQLAAFEKEKAEAAKTGAPFSKSPPQPPWKPSELYNGMLSPLMPFAIKGVAWYQGEADAFAVHLYRTLLGDLIRNWRADWGEGDFPFLIVQIAPFGGTTDRPYRRSEYSELREAQMNTAKTLPKTSLIATTDVGESANIHPRRKQPVGARLALAARAIAYGEPIVYSGPIYKGMKVEGNRIIVSFDHVGGGLEARGGELKGFAICGEDEVFVWAEAKIDAASGNQRVIVSSPQVRKPVAVRFGWVNTPDVNLWNKEGLPASPFRTDNFPFFDAHYREIEAKAARLYQLFPEPMKKPTDGK